MPRRFFSHGRKHLVRFRQDEFVGGGTELIYMRIKFALTVGFGRFVRNVFFRYGQQQAVDDKAEPDKKSDKAETGDHKDVLLIHKNREDRKSDRGAETDPGDQRPDTHPAETFFGGRFKELFDLRQHIQFNTKVVMARPLEAEHPFGAGRWEVELASGEKRIYKGILVCNGHHWDRRWPSYPGQFDGETIHSKDYKRPEQLAGKRVLVIGGGNSACDIASEAARVGECSHLSLRRGYWFLPKTIFGLPLVEWIKGWMPVFAQRIFMSDFAL